MGEMIILQILNEAQSKAYFIDHAQHNNTLYNYQTHDMGLNHKNTDSLKGCDYLTLDSRCGHGSYQAIINLKITLV